MRGSLLVGLLVPLMAGMLIALGACPGPEPQFGADGGGTSEGGGGAGGIVGGAGGDGGDGGAGGAMGGGGSGGSTDCDCDSVDVLFVLDNTDSIEPIAQGLALSFLSLAGDLEALADRVCDLHVGVVTARRQDDNPAPCDTFGALSRVNASDELCPLSNGRFATKEDDLLQAVSCLIVPGSRNDGNEAPIDAMLTALSPAMNAPNGCNAGFFRPEAALVVLLISDVDDTETTGDTDAWYTSLTMLNAGDASMVASLGLFGPASNPPQECDAEAAPTLHDFLGEFPIDNRAVTNICDAEVDDLKSSLARLTEAICPLPE